MNEVNGFFIGLEGLAGAWTDRWGRIAVLSSSSSSAMLADSLTTLLIKLPLADNDICITATTGMRRR
jgi:hypothetical protein